MARGRVGRQNRRSTPALELNLASFLGRLEGARPLSFGSSGDLAVQTKRPGDGIVNGFDIAAVASHRQSIRPGIRLGPTVRAL